MQATIFPQGISAIAAPALYADILAVFAPTEANAGEQVTVKVHIKNIYTSRISVKTSAIIFVGTDAVDSVVFPTDWIDLDPGISYQFEGYFTMPNGNVRLHAVSYWYGADGNWHIDETMDVYIALVEALLAEFTRVRYWDASIGQYVSEPPTVQIGSEVGADFIVENVSGQSLDIGLCRLSRSYLPSLHGLGRRLLPAQCQ
ncbi:unnamed protein product [marine sediment metagenome]|uniref:CARDB domain-containing protein n=1 Tax=marine sediment metagenome TaxID=412755 RepID=X1VHK6_9ZZZZ